MQAEDQEGKNIYRNNFAQSWNTIRIIVHNLKNDKPRSHHSKNQHGGIHLGHIIQIDW